MDKQELLQHVQELSSEHAITAEELITAYNQGAGTAVAAPVEDLAADAGVSKHVSIGNILSYIGGAVIFTGIAIVIGSSWESLSIFTRILLTLGSGMAAYMTGLLFSRQEKYGGVSNAFFFLSALVMPVGLFVVLDSAGVDSYTAESQSVITALLVIIFGLSAYLLRRIIFIIATIIFATWLFFALAGSMVGSNPILGGNFYLYQILLVGLSYMLLGYYFSMIDQRAALSGWLYGFGSLGFLGSALALGGWAPDQSYFWELIYPLLVFGVIFLSVYVKSRAFLVWGSIFLMGYILKLTAEYFSQGLGWPLALVIAGLLLIGVGYFTVYFNKTYLAKRRGERSAA